MKSEFVLTQSTGQKLEFAVNRNGCGASEIEWLSSMDNFKQVAMLASGKYELRPVVKAFFLADMEPLTINIDQSLNLSEIFKKSAAVDEVEALWVDFDFGKILALATVVPLPVSVTVKPHLLKNNANDSKIKGELPFIHEHEPTTFVWMLATELMKVRVGRPSMVLRKGYWCIFYVASLQVFVYWENSLQRWSVRVREQNQHTWPAGHIVFSSS